MARSDCRVRPLDAMTMNHSARWALALALSLALASIQPCNSLGYDDSDDEWPFIIPLSYRLLPLLGAVAFVLVLCYIFHPAYANHEGGLGCTATILAGENARSDQGNNIMLSLIIPAYNEAERLPIMLDATIEFLNTNRKELTQLCRAVGNNQQQHYSSQHIRCEFIIVDDGSTDNTTSVVTKYASNMKNGDTVKLVSMHQNCGKGGAVKTGMLQSSGRLCLMADADGATDISDGLPKLLKRMKVAMDERQRKNNNDAANNNNNNNNDDNTNNSGHYLPPAAVFGSRAHLEKESRASRSKVRTVLMHAFHFFVRTLCSNSIEDTQCGFKLFTRSAAVTLFANLHLRRWAFDTELIVIAEKLDVLLSEVGVVWHEIDGSKLDVGKISLALVSLGMLRDMVCVRACYTLGIWRLKR